MQSGPRNHQTMHGRSQPLAHAVTACVSAAGGTRTAPGSGRLQHYPKHTNVVDPPRPGFGAWRNPAGLLFSIPANFLFPSDKCPADLMAEFGSRG